ncbi:MAG: EF-P lysine aminoacylase GenX [Thermomonas sp.]|uniref:EF-P lysine aminoacylase EpmA n=1 Tax=Thermomonas sp. TaxID=1971895 RepID=UPI001D763E28|nr:EF-P lysine aminoacylase EpmA [Thermomonas sp.]MBZ0088240.1 EF-P lysine aminoacylase GenX [Thermomonas sp.]
MPDWQPSADLAALRLRAAFNCMAREFFQQRQVLEVETPILSAAGNTEPNIASFHTEFSGHVDAGPRRRWLRTSPEYPLKRLLAAGVGDCYELGRVFRNGEAGGRHNPEFTLLEWYRVGWDHLRLIEETAEFVNAALALVGRRATLRVVGYRALYLETLGLDPFEADGSHLQETLGDVQVNSEGLSRDDWLDLLMTHRIQPTFPVDALIAVHDWPATQAALARIRPGDPPLAERFELYLGPIELANGYHELGDATEQRERFENDLHRRRVRGAALPPIDEALLAALPALPDCAGVALGVDRLLMALRGNPRIDAVLAFDFARA